VTAAAALIALAVAAAPEATAVPSASPAAAGTAAGTAAAPGPSAAPAPSAPDTAAATGASDSPSGPDVVLHVPRAEVGKLSLDVENLEARLDVNTRVANVVEISAGVVANVQKLKMEAEQIGAETHLVVRLERVAQVMERALGTIDRHPDIAAGPSVLATPVPASAPAPSTAAPPAPSPGQE
jgi:uncharacterized protein YunC (DUF1805 family)